MYEVVHHKFRNWFRRLRRDGRIPLSMTYLEWVRRTATTALVSMPSERCPWEREAVTYARAHGVVP